MKNGKCSWINLDKSKCEDSNHHTLHKVKQHIGCLNWVNAACTSENNPFGHDLTLMEAQRIPVQNDQASALKTNVLHDSASTITRCRHDWAKGLDLKSQEYHMELQVVSLQT